MRNGRRTMRIPVIPLVAGTLLAACGYVSEYEKGVYDYEAIY